MLRNLTIKTRLVFIIAFLCLQLIVGAVIGIVGLGKANDAMKSLYDDRLVAVGQMYRTATLLNHIRVGIEKALSDDASQMTKRLDEIDANMERVNTIWKEFLATKLTEEEKKLADQFAQHRDKFIGESVTPAVSALRAQNVTVATDIVYGPLDTLFPPIQQGVDALIKLQLDVAKTEYEASQSAYILVRNSCIAGLLFGLVLAFFIGAWLVRAVSRPLEEAVQIASGIAAGDLTQKIEVRSNDETGRLTRALKDMNTSLANVISQVRTGTDTVATASYQIAAGNLDLSSRTEQQAGSLEETASSMEELTSTVKQNADNARQANTLAASASDIAVKGGAVVSEVVSTMDSINTSAKRIVDIISVIDGIAFQTNILALNASVEAARAGEQGRGFAVVASEVRNLAQRSAQAAKEIKELIADSVDKVDTGTRLVDQAGATMKEIVDSIRRVTDIMGEITAASEEQTAGIEQVNQAISQMDQVTQQNAALVEQAAAASEALQEQANNLAQIVSVFKLTDGAGSASLSFVKTEPSRLDQSGTEPHRPALGRSTRPLSIASR